MKKHRLNIILNKCRKKKYKSGFISYLRSLDFEEFEILFNYYNSVIARLMFRYKSKNEKISFLSKKWFRNEELNYKFSTLNLLFREANNIFVEKADKKISDNNKRISELLTKIQEIKKSLEYIKNAKLIFNENPDMIDMLNLIAILTEYIYNKNESQKIIDEINKLNK